jgi:hypothetical protein
MEVVPDGLQVRSALAYSNLRLETSKRTILMAEQSNPAGGSEDQQARRREAIRRLALAAAVPVVLATVAGHPRPARAE